MEADIEIEGRKHSFRLVARDGKTITFALGEKQYVADILSSSMDKVALRLNGHPIQVTLKADGEDRWTAGCGERNVAVRASFFAQAGDWLKTHGAGEAARAGERGPTPGGAVQAPMPGKVLDVFVEAGDTVNAGDALLTLEAMKMENRIEAPSAGTVEEVRVQAGSEVGKGDVLVVLAST